MQFPNHLLPTITMELFRRGASSLFGSSNVSLASSRTDTDTDFVGDNTLAQKGFRSISESYQLFNQPDPAVDGEECLHDCASCTVKYPAKFDVDQEDELYGQVKGWATHLLVATGKSDWVRDVADEVGSVMEAIEKGGVEPSNGVRPIHYNDLHKSPLSVLLPGIENSTTNMAASRLETQIVSIKHARSRRIPHA